MPWVDAHRDGQESQTGDSPEPGADQPVSLTPEDASQGDATDGQQQEAEREEDERPLVRVIEDSALAA